MAGTKKTAGGLSSDAWMQVFARLPDVGDKARLSSVCQATLQASQAPTAWERCDVLAYPEPSKARVGLFGTLAKHAQHIQHMQSSIKTSEALGRLELVWLFLPSLRSLDVTLSTEALQHHLTSGFKLPHVPDGLVVKLKNMTSQRVLFKAFQKFGQQLDKLNIESSHSAGYYGRTEVIFCDEDLPTLCCLRLEGPHSFHGQLNASSLVCLAIQSSSESTIAWKTFDQCQSLLTISIITPGMVIFDGCDRASLASIQTLQVTASSIREDGAFLSLDSSKLVSLMIRSSKHILSRFCLGHLNRDSDLKWMFSADSTCTTFRLHRC